MKSSYIKFIALTIFISFSTNSFSQKQHIIDSLYSVEDLKSDFSILRATLEEVHPGLYIHQTKESLDKLFKASESKITKPMTSVEFAILLGKLTSQIGDGHLQLAPPEDFFKRLQSGTFILPFSISSYENKIYASKDYSELQSKDFVGSEIISINGLRMNDFLKEYLSMISSDGGNLTRKYRLLSKEKRLNPYMSMLIGFNNTYVVDYKPLNESVSKKIEVKGIDSKKLSEVKNKRYPNSDLEKQPVELQIDKVNSTAYLRISTFSAGVYKRSDINFSNFLQNTFKELDSLAVSNLIIDVRGNSGGEDKYGKDLFSYFIDKEFKYYKSLTANKDGFDSFIYTEKTKYKTNQKECLRKMTWEPLILLDIQMWVPKNLQNLPLRETLLFL